MSSDLQASPSPLALPGYAHVYSGKVRELYAPIDHVTGTARQDRLLLVATDRISAYDHILDSEIPDKGKVLTQLSDRVHRAGLSDRQRACRVPPDVLGLRRSAARRAAGRLAAALADLHADDQGTDR